MREPFPPSPPGDRLYSVDILGCPSRRPLVARGMLMLAPSRLLDAPKALFAKLSMWVRDFVVMLPNLVLAALTIALGIVVSRLARRLVERLLVRTSGNEPISRLLASVCRVAILGFAALSALSLLHLDRAVTSMLAGVGVVGLALGFAFQDIAANFMAGFMMTINRPFNVGDQVELANHQCRVLRVELRATEVETLDGLSILIPNREVFQNPIINYTRTQNRRMALSIGTAYSNDMQTVRRVIVEAVQGVPHRDPEREVEVFFESFGDSSINCQLRVWLLESTQIAFLRARSEAMIAIKRAFDRNGITIPFPIRTLDFGAKVAGGVRLDELGLEPPKPDAEGERSSESAAATK